MSLLYFRKTFKATAFESIHDTTETIFCLVHLLSNSEPKPFMSH